MASSSTTALTVKQKVGLEMLSEALEGEFDAAFGVLVKVLGNLVAHPDDAKYRKLRTSNAKVQAMLAEMGIDDVSRPLLMSDLVGGEDCIFAATGVTEGELLKGVKTLKIAVFKHDLTP